MKTVKAVYTCDVCKKEFQHGYVFYGDVNIIADGDVKNTIVKPTEDERHICHNCAGKLFGNVSVR